MFSCFFFVGPKTDRMKNGRFGWSYIYAPCGDLFPPVGTGRSLAGVCAAYHSNQHGQPQETSPSPAFFHQGQATFSWTPCDPSPPRATKVMKNCDVKEGKEKLGIILVKRRSKRYQKGIIWMDCWIIGLIDHKRESILNRKGIIKEPKNVG